MAVAPGAQAKVVAAPGRDERLARMVFALLVIASFAAFFVTQRLKHTPTAVQRFQHSPSFSPHAADPERRQERISFKLAHADAVTVAIIDSSGSVVATLVRDRPLERYKQFSVRWNGHRGTAHRYREVVTASGHRSLIALSSGRLAPPGEYRVRVTLRRQDREVLSPWSFKLVPR
jgi:hypothetical protein